MRLKSGIYAQYGKAVNTSQALWDGMEEEDATGNVSSSVGLDTNPGVCVFFFADTPNDDNTSRDEYTIKSMKQVSLCV